MPMVVERNIYSHNNEIYGGEETYMDPMQKVCVSSAVCMGHDCDFDLNIRGFVSRFVYSGTIG